MNVSSMCFSNPLNKEIKNALECIVELYKYAGIEEREELREVLFVLNNSKVLILVNNTRGRSIFSISFMK